MNMKMLVQGATLAVLASNVILALTGGGWPDLNVAIFVNGHGLILAILSNSLEGRGI